MEFEISIPRAGNCCGSRGYLCSLGRVTTAASLPAQDKFYKLKAYKKMFGHPKLDKNIAKGHKLVRIHGKKGVAVPNESDSDEELGEPQIR